MEDDFALAEGSDEEFPFAAFTPFGEAEEEVSATNTRAAEESSFDCAKIQRPKSTVIEAMRKLFVSGLFIFILGCGEKLSSRSLFSDDLVDANARMVFNHDDLTACNATVAS